MVEDNNKKYVQGRMIARIKVLMKIILIQQLVSGFKGEVRDGVSLLTAGGYFPRLSSCTSQGLAEYRYFQGDIMELLMRERDYVKHLMKLVNEFADDDYWQKYRQKLEEKKDFKI